MFSNYLLSIAYDFHFDYSFFKKFVDFLSGLNRNFLVNFPVNLNSIFFKLTNLKKEAYVSSNEGKKKIFIIPDGENLNTEAANALLKVLEEPSATAMIIITASGEDSVPETVLSRTVAIQVKHPTPEEAVQAGISSEAVKVFGGNLGKGNRYDTDEDFRKAVSVAKDIVVAACDREGELELILAAAPLEQSRQFFEDTIQILADIYLKIALYKSGAYECDDLFYKEVCKLYTAKQAVQGQNVCKEAIRLVRQNLSLPLIATWLVSNVKI